MTSGASPAGCWQRCAVGERVALRCISHRSETTSGCATFVTPQELGSHAQVPIQAHRSVSWTLLQHIPTHPKGMEDLGSSTIAQLPAAHSQLLICSLFQTKDKAGPGIAATAESSDAQTQLLLCKCLQTMGKAGLATSASVGSAGAQRQLLLCK